MQAKIRRLNQVAGYEHVTRKMIREWSKAGPGARRGRPVDEDFESQVIGEFIYSEMEKVNDVETAVVKANVHSNTTHSVTQC
eukprot:5923804-Prymnesium_polylepis.1